MSKPVELTPLMKQYFSIKEQYPGALLLFRVGDFYETFLEDAVQASKILGIVLTKRANGSAASVELAGFPHHSLETYLPKLVKAGHRVAICDQIEDPKQAKGLVQRAVTELVTPGLSFNESVLDHASNNYLGAVFFDKGSMGISFLDLTTGEFFLAQGDCAYGQKLLQHFAPSEVLFNKKQRELWVAFANDAFHTYALDDWVFQFDYAYGLLNTHFGTHSLKGFGIEAHPLGIVAAGAILRYLSETEHNQVKHINSIVRLEAHSHLWLDAFTVRALELIVPQQAGGTSLMEVLDQTVTPMGARLLKKWILFPLKEVSSIQERLDTVAYFVDHAEAITLLVGWLKQIGDLERLISKVAAGRIHPREMATFRKALEQIQPIQKTLEDSEFNLLKKLAEQLHRCSYLVESIQEKLQDNPPLLTNQGGMIKPGINSKLDEWNALIHNSKDYLVQLQQKESQQTDIPSLKISYNRVFGYYLEVPNAHKNKVPSSWMRKQTLTNAERYITEELKYYEENITQATEQAQLLEQQLYQELVHLAMEFIPQVQQNARTVAQLDCYLSFAQQAALHGYCKPTVDHGTLLDLKGNRHPVIEQSLPLGTAYVHNDVFLDQETQQIMVVTGPNMAGKSALLRQVALTVIMAQMGSFVPADAAHIGIVDKLFTRVGASDNMAKGESTFMMEMTETASIVHNLSDRSLILMDEIGRGTSTYDGISIAWALVEHLHNHKKYKPKTLFATHYHELNELANALPRVKNYNVAVQEANGKVLFLHKLVPGGIEYSFGIHVAQMAGMPASILERASEVLQHLSNVGANVHTKRMETVPKVQQQLTIFHADDAWHALQAWIDAIDVNALSPIEALLKLREIKNKIKQAKKHRP
ncbi:MAG TPA: DNA mismatch repair protein MutS [Amoebophilaceae bacterium]|nr:DNA mismatch repair protein MutS [Amoebophilaceae bacterium]